jgi:hypothetical protein
MSHDLELEAITHRTGNTEALGKCDSRLEIPMPQDMRDHIAALATIEGVSPAEWGRRELSKLLYGQLAIMRRSVNRDV